ncbi:hypothetical protein SGFS_078300 [Streptomyces graminofaciens]|uniref:Uncharacterized protein n=1 Tax=Streptomyces graminofaciens TaxID=68212 RepID=A0ABM7FHG7_9ACTN|nr:hypothetical protein SGFS_078300 [Streptomyces graminofaciens]
MVRDMSGMIATLRGGTGVPSIDLGVLWASGGGAGAGRELRHPGPGAHDHPRSRPRPPVYARIPSVSPGQRRFGGCPHTPPRRAGNPSHSPRGREEGSVPREKQT